MAGADIKTDDTSTGGTVTAGLVVIGDEVLSGRTKDRNIGYVAEYLTNIGIDLVEVRIVGDREGAIVEAVNTLRARCDYVFTTGGIGPTHDDITADSIGAAFGVPVDVDPRARAVIAARVKSPADLTPARLRMARFPAGAEPIHNPVAGPPGFRIGNVYVMAGVPAVMQGMLDEAAKTLRTGRRMMSITVEIRRPEGAIGDRLAEIQKESPGVLIGSYPSFDENGYLTRIVLRARDESLIEPAAALVRRLADDNAKP